MVVLKQTHQISLVGNRKKESGVKKGQISLCLRKHVSF